MRRAVFLDRDGVINAARVIAGKPYPPRTMEELIIPDEVPQALMELKRCGLLLFVVTNQPDVARGAQRREVVEELHAFIRSQLPLDDIRVCYHDSADNCACRKPLPGMLLDLASDYDVDMPGSYLVGDRWRDIQAGARAGCHTILLDRSYAEEWQGPQPEFVVKSLQEAVDIIAARLSKGESL